MRTQLLGGLTTLLAGAAFLCGPGAARAQYQPAPGAGGYPQGYGVPAQAAGFWRGGSGYGYSPYPQGYGYNPYYANPYSFTSAAPKAADGYPQGSSGFAAHVEGPGPYVPVMPMVPVALGHEELPGDDGGAAADQDKGHGRTAGCSKDCFWFSAGYEMAWFRPWRLTTPLLTQGSQADAHPGALGQPGTTILFGDQADFGRSDGVRLGLGASLDGGEHLYVELLGFYVFPNHVHVVASSDATGAPIITRPFFNAVEGTERAFFTSNPGVASGTSFIDARSDLLGAELNTRLACRPSDCLRFDLLAGFRFLRLHESLTIRDSLQALEPGVFTFLRNPVDAGDVITDVDSFKTVNHFYGAQLGAQATWEGKWLFASAFGKAALGVTDQEIDINGSSALFTPAQAFVAGGGILALPSNIGQHSRSVLGFVPEGGFTVGVKVTPHVRLTAGYSFLWWNAVVRPGAQIDRVVNPTMVPTDNSFGTLTGPARPAFRFADETFWIHTLTLGLDLHF